MMLLKIIRLKKIIVFKKVNKLQNKIIKLKNKC